MAGKKGIWPVKHCANYLKGALLEPVKEENQKGFELRFYVPFETKRVISETFFPANLLSYHNHHNRFTALFPGPPRWAGARR